MNRVLRIVLYAVIMFLIFLWVSSIYKSCQKDSMKEQVPATLEEQEPQEEDILGDLFEDDNSFEPDGNMTEEEDLPVTSFDDEPENITEAKPSAPARQEKVTKSEDYSSFEQEEIQPVSRQNSGGKYLVISGSYLIRSNAEIMVKKLKKMGFDKAEIVQFDLSQYHSICAGRYDSQSSAQSIVSQLKSQGIDSYVHVKK